jgi:capsular polysaccharide biosynthesis protein
MEITDYLKILRKRGWIIVVVAIVAAASAFVFSKLQTPIYSANVKLSVVPARATDWGSSNTLKDLLRNYAENIHTHTMSAEVIDRAQLDMETTTFLSKFFVNPDSSTFTLELEARDRDPEVAMAMVDTMAKVFAEDRDQWNQEQDKRDRIEVKMLDSVYNLGFEQYSPKTKINTLAGGLFGALVGVLVIFFLEWLEMDIIRTSEDVERASGVTVLAAIPPVSSDTTPPAREKKRRQLVPRPRSTN